jgi:hypothetical protein
MDEQTKQALIKALVPPPQPTPEMLPPGQVRSAGYDAQFHPIYLDLKLRAAQGEIPDPGEFTQWKAQQLQQQLQQQKSVGR